MENLFMSAGVVTAIVLCLVGILKLPFKSFKKSHSIWYKALFTTLSLAFAIGLSVINELYILCGELLSVDFAVLVSVVIAGVFCGYGGVYEGLGLKELVKKLVENVKKARDMSKNKKTVEYLNKIDDIDIDNAIKILEERKNNASKIDEV